MARPEPGSAPVPRGLVQVPFGQLEKETPQCPHAVSMQEKPMSTPLNFASSAERHRLTRLAVAKAKEGDAEGIHHLYDTRTTSAGMSPPS